jgi:hypothetical protein
MKNHILKGCVPLIQSIFFSLLFFSCLSGPNYKKVDTLVETGEFEEALKTVEVAQRPQKQEDRLYPDNNRLLHELDRGMISHYNGDYGKSSEQLQEGERLIEELYIKSITLEAASYIANDTVREYAGEDYEDVYLNLFNSLNYYHRGNLEGALVEIRRMNQKLQWLPDSYREKSSRVRDYARSVMNNITFPNQEISNFTDSVFARYLGMLFWRGAGNPDSARIDYEFMENAHRSFPWVYRNPLPATTGQELSVPSGMARLNILAFAGLSPEKQEKRETYLGMDYYLPEMVDARSTDVAHIEIVIDGGQTIRLELLENIGDVIHETYKSKYGLTFLKTFVRSSIKQLASGAAGAAARLGSLDGSEEGRQTSETLAFLAKSYIDQTEAADTRMARYFPRYVYVTGVNLWPGTYSFSINYYDANNRVIHRDGRRDVRVQAGQLNMVESFHLGTARQVDRRVETRVEPAGQADRRVEVKKERDNKVAEVLGNLGQRITINYTGTHTGIDSNPGYYAWVPLVTVVSPILLPIMVGVTANHFTMDHSLGLGYEIGTLYLDVNAGLTYAGNSYEKEKRFMFGNMDFGSGFKFNFGPIEDDNNSLIQFYYFHLAFGYRLRLPGLFDFGQDNSPDSVLRIVHAVEAKMGVAYITMGYRYEFWNEAYHDMISRWEDKLGGVHHFTIGYTIPIVLKHSKRDRERMRS